MESLIPALQFHADRQAARPEVALAIDRAGVTRLRRSLRATIAGRVRELLATLTMTTDLPADRAGVHMSRFSEQLGSLLDATLDDASRAHRPLVTRLGAVAEAIRQVQAARAAEVTFETFYPFSGRSPVTGQEGEEFAHLQIRLWADAHGLRALIGVEVEGMTACPCAQLMVREQAERDLGGAGFTPEAIEQVLAIMPIASHNQRGRARLSIGLPLAVADTVVIEEMIAITEEAMSSPTYELLKRPDEYAVVERAHRRPRFVEDVVRALIAGVLSRSPALPDTAYLIARQINDESIHKHDAVAELAGTVAEFRQELRCGRAHDDRTLPRTSLAAWVATDRNEAS